MSATTNRIRRSWRSNCRTRALALADAFDAIDGDQWQRRGRRSDGASFTIATFAQYMIHDPIHHLWDVDAPSDAVTRKMPGSRHAANRDIFGFAGANLDGI